MGLREKSLEAASATGRIRCKRVTATLPLRANEWMEVLVIAMGMGWVEKAE